METQNETPHELFSDEELQNIAALTSKLKAIRRRIYSEGIDVDKLIQTLQNADEAIASQYDL